jgi:hypothetical protein
VNGCEEIPLGLFVACRDGAELPELGEEVLDQMALFVDFSIEIRGRLAVSLGWDHGGFPCGCQRCDDPCIGIKCFAGDQHVGLHRRQEMVGALQIMGLAAGQEETYRVSQRIDQGVDLGAQSAT